MHERSRPLLKTLVLPLFLSLGAAACTNGENQAEDPVQANKTSEAAANPDQGTPPALAVATVASLISVDDVMVREPERFKKALCSDGNIYDLEFDGARFSLRAEPLSVCVLFADTKQLKPQGFCGDTECAASPVNPCSDAEKKELGETFAKDQIVQHCWGIGAYPPLTFNVLVSRVGQSCQAQSLVKTAKGWKTLNTIDGTFESRKSEAGEGQGCFFEAGTENIADSEWFSRGKRVVPVMTFEKQGGLYALLKTSWTGSENYQLFRVDGDKAMEVESFAESFKEPVAEPTPPPPAPEAKTPEPKVKGKKGKKADKTPKAEPAPVPREEATPPAENPPEVPNANDKPQEEPIPEQGVNPLEGEQ